MRQIPVTKTSLLAIAIALAVPAALPLLIGTTVEIPPDGPPRQALQDAALTERASFTLILTGESRSPLISTSALGYRKADPPVP